MASTTLAAYADWIGLDGPLRLGWLHARRGAGREVFEFEFDTVALAHPALRNLHLDPRLGFFDGRQHPPQGHGTFGVFADASPDRWGRLLMRRRLERAQRSVRDEHNVGAWELLVQTLAQGCGLAVPQSLARQFASPHHTFLVKRFDRAPEGRLHFASAMALTGRVDGDDASTGASYLEIARVLIDHGAQTDADLCELWSRVVFNMLVSNTDDHLRNHGFILVPGKGWRLSPAYDMNPVPESRGLTLNVSEADNARDLDLARSVAPYFRVSKKRADEIIERSRAVVKQWPKIADSLQIRPREQERMAAAFELAG